MLKLEPKKLQLGVKKKWLKFRLQHSIIYTFSNKRITSFNNKKQSAAKLMHMRLHQDLYNT